MSRPWKHPKTGVYWLRRRVPAHLRAVLGKAEEKRSLGTKDPAEAKRLFIAAMQEVETRWANLSNPAPALSEREADDVATSIYHWYLAVNRDNPSEQRQWKTKYGHLCFVERSAEELSQTLRDIGQWSESEIWRVQMESWCAELAAELRKSKGLPDTPTNNRRLARGVAKALQAASLELEALAAGKYTFGLPNISSAPAVPALQKPSSGRVAFSELLDGWAAERKPAAKTRYTVERMLLQLSEFVGHDDASQLTTAKLLEWKTSLIAAGISARTIKSTKFGMLKPVLQWGVDNGKIASNPAEKITVAAVKAGGGRRSFNDTEALLVLQKAEQASKSYLRWVPLVCAYTGARLSEVCQVRTEDVIEIDGIWCIKFVPEAGSLKNANSERLVPLHTKVISAGFLEFVSRQKAGPLFTELMPDRFGNRGGTGTKLIGRWVRELGIEDPRVSPSHSWRHRFKTLGRRHGLALDIVNAMTGHGRKDVASSYGEFEPSALARELAKLP